jgi:hypothetical protein
MMQFDIYYGHQGLNPGGHSFVFLNVAINKKPLFFSEVVVSENGSWKTESRIFVANSLASSQD